MERERFEWLVAKAIADLPDEFRERMDNVDIVVQDEPTSGQIADAGLKRSETLLGLYEGVPLTRRSRSYGMVPPDKITIFQKPIEARYRGEAQIQREIQRVVKHETAHHFGISDARLNQLERDK
ncbi:MAG: metallopeptidase family protein [Dehalococcoidales bacterium]|nr:metallopeptidase family protein [Dehalococcoidales bacterium]